ncbi:MAG: hypothetical protein GY816_02910, partial [Cytophagales bacterium]|nr:hypothetical protein [Cytophagales bacterium]
MKNRVNYYPFGLTFNSFTRSYSEPQRYKFNGKEEQHNYILAVRMYPNVKSEVWGLNDWVSLTKGIELNEMIFSHENGKP